MPYSHLSNAVISNDTAASIEHQEAMVAQPVDVRDGDDSITFNIEPVVHEEENVDRVEINTETGEASGEEEEITLEEGEPEHEQTEELSEELTELPDVGDIQSFEEAGKAVHQAQEGTEEIIKSALERGLPPEMVPTLQAEYASDEGLSEASYEALAEAGYSKTFVDAYIQGQEAIAAKFVETIYDYAGGKDTFAKLQETMGQNDSMAQAFNDALDRNDVVTMKALMDSARTTLTQKYGNRPARDLAKVAKPAAAPKAAPSVQPFESRGEMVQAMADPRYSRDPAYRQAVEARVAISF